MTEKDDIREIVKATLNVDYPSEIKINLVRPSNANRACKLRMCAYNH